MFFVNDERSTTAVLRVLLSMTGLISVGAAVAGLHKLKVVAC